MQNIICDLGPFSSADDSCLATKDDIPDIPDMSNYVTTTTFNGHGHTITPSKSPDPTSGSGTHNFMYNFTTSSGTNGFTYTYGYVSGSLSDERLKENIKPIEDISDKYMKLIPIQFNFYDDIRSVYKGIHYGFSAQKVAEIFNNDNLALICREHQEDEAINKYLNEDDAYVLDKDELHALHVQMIQKHQREIEQLKSDNFALKGEVDILKQRLGKMEEMLNVINSKIN